MEDILPEERDITLQRASASLIADIEHALPSLLRIASTQRLRRNIKKVEVEKVIKLVGEFQEWPQLLDGHLSKFLHQLCSALLEYLSRYGRTYLKQPLHESMPLPRGVCQIIYTFCKVRGQKVIVQLLNNEPRHLEPLLKAFEFWDQYLFKQSIRYQTHISTGRDYMDWQEKYVMMLWLSHLMLTPFDLTSIVSDDFESTPAYLDLPIKLPSKTPVIARRLIKIAILYRSSPRKEQEAGKTLLASLALRADMQKIDLHSSLINWALADIRSLNVSPDQPVYAIINLLAFLAAFLKSAYDTAILPIIGPVWNCVQMLMIESSNGWITSLVVIQRFLVKILRLLGTILYRLQTQGFETILNSILQHLFSLLDNSDTSLRLAASKALGLLASRFDSDMNTQLVEMIWQNLSENFDWRASYRVFESRKWDIYDQRLRLSQSSYDRVNAQLWHGNIFTMAHMLHRRSVPYVFLTQCAACLVAALNFSQKLALKALGDNVRDAACYGVWALARKYRTSEIDENEDNPLHGTRIVPLQGLAQELIKAACLDPENNIRRAASAALQEMIGRHPDQIDLGISLVGTVDYHAVASKSNAMIVVALKVSRLTPAYWQTVVEGLMEWRGIQNHDAYTRSVAAKSLGYVATASYDCVDTTTLALADMLQSTPPLLFDVRQGRSLALAAIIETVQELVYHTGEVVMPTNIKEILQNNQLDTSPKHTVHDSLNRRNLWRSLTYTVKPPTEGELLRYKEAIMDSDSIFEATAGLLRALASATRQETPWPLKAYENLNETELLKYLEIVIGSLSRQNRSTRWICSRALYALLRIAPLNIGDKYLATIMVTAYPNSQTGTGQERLGFISALGVVFSYAQILDHQTGGSTTRQRKVVETLLRIIEVENSVTIKCEVLQSIAIGPLTSGVFTAAIFSVIMVGLNDYTNDQRLGDIGSFVRITAIDAANIALSRCLAAMEQFQLERLIMRICALATEHMDKVRLKAALCLEKNWQAFIQGRHSASIKSVQDISTKDYFLTFLQISASSVTGTEILKGFITSASRSAPRNLVEASRAALAEYTFKSPEHLIRIASALKSFIDHRESDRITVPAMEVLGFLYQLGLWRQLELQRGMSRSFQNLFAAITQVHYKSNDLRKLEAAVDVYSGLATLKMSENQRVRKMVLGKLCGMLGMPFFKIRSLVADALFLALNTGSADGPGDDVWEDAQKDNVLWEMLHTNWMGSPHEFKKVMERLKERIEQL